jgi:hypothetical protein
MHQGTFPFLSRETLQNIKDFFLKSSSPFFKKGLDESLLPLIQLAGTRLLVHHLLP